MKKTLYALAFVSAVAAQPATAGVCDYRLSEWIGNGGTSAAAAVTGTVGGAGAAGKMAGLYAIKNAATGLWMLGSTAGGVSGAGTVGIMGGTAGTGAAVLGVALNPFVWIPMAGAAAGIAVHEGGCFFLDD